MHEITIKVKITSDDLKILRVLNGPGAGRAVDIARQSGVANEEVGQRLDYLIYYDLAHTVVYGAGWNDVHYTIFEDENECSL